MPEIGVPELLIILAVVVLVFGVGRLPEVGGALGKSIREFRREVRSEEPGKTEQRAGDGVAGGPQEVTPSRPQH
jgi:sec-independent protein translocase protein TatA